MSTDPFAAARKLLDRWGGKDGYQPPNSKCWKVFADLVQAGSPAPEFDALLPVPTQDAQLAEAVRLVEALPAERRLPAILASLERSTPTDAARAGVVWLAHLPDRRIADLALERSKDSDIMRPSKVRAALADLGITPSQPAPTVHRGASLRPTAPSDLSPLQTEQLLAAARGHDGKSVPIEKRFGPDDGSETSFGTTIEVSTVTADLRTFDIVQFAGDAGSVFEGGTTTELASIVQGGLECDDPQLADLIGAALDR